MAKHRTSQAKVKRIVRRRSTASYRRTQTPAAKQVRREIDTAVARGTALRAEIEAKIRRSAKTPKRGGP